MPLTSKALDVKKKAKKTRGLIFSLSLYSVKIKIKLRTLLISIVYLLKLLKFLK